MLIVFNSIGDAWGHRTYSKRRFWESSVSKCKYVLTVMNGCASLGEKLWTSVSIKGGECYQDIQLSLSSEVSNHYIYLLYSLMLLWSMYISKYMDFEDFITVEDFSVLQFEKVIQMLLIKHTEWNYTGVSWTLCHCLSHRCCLTLH